MSSAPRCLRCLKSSASKVCKTPRGVVGCHYTGDGDEQKNDEKKEPNGTPEPNDTSDPNDTSELNGTSEPSATQASNPPVLQNSDRAEGEDSNTSGGENTPDAMDWSYSNEAEGENMPDAMDWSSGYDADDEMTDSDGDVNQFYYDTASEEICVRWC